MLAASNVAEGYVRDFAHMNFAHKIFKMIFFFWKFYSTTSSAHTSHGFAQQITGELWACKHTHTHTCINMCVTFPLLCVQLCGKSSGSLVACNNNNNHHHHNNNNNNDCYLLSFVVFSVFVMFCFVVVAYLHLCGLKICTWRTFIAHT